MLGFFLGVIKVELACFEILGPGLLLIKLLIDEFLDPLHELDVSSLGEEVLLGHPLGRQDTFGAVVELGLEHVDSGLLAIAVCDQEDMEPLERLPDLVVRFQLTDVVAQNLQDLDQQIHALGTGSLVNVVEKSKELLGGLSLAVCMDLDEHSPVLDSARAADGLWSDLALFLRVLLLFGKVVLFRVFESLVETVSLGHLPLIVSVPNAEYPLNLLIEDEELMLRYLPFGLGELGTSTIRA